MTARPRPARHPLAVLRGVLGLSQTDLARVVHKHMRTIYSVEAGLLPLSEELARLISEHTGVDAGWLLEGDPAAPPRRSANARGAKPDRPEWNLAVYERHRASSETSPAAKQQEADRKKLRPETIDQAGFSADLGLIDSELRRMLDQLLDQSAMTRDADLVRWKVRRLLEGLATENSIELKRWERKGYFCSLAFDRPIYLTLLVPTGWKTGTASDPDTRQFIGPKEDILEFSVKGVDEKSPQPDPLPGGVEGKLLQPATYDPRCPSADCLTSVAQSLDQATLYFASTYRFGRALVSSRYVAPASDEAYTFYDRFVRSVYAQVVEMVKAAEKPGIADIPQV